MKPCLQKMVNDYNRPEEQPEENNKNNDGIISSGPTAVEKDKEEEFSETTAQDDLQKTAADVAADTTANESMATPPWWILPLIVLSQFGGTSLWFAGNAILPDLAQELDLPDSALGLVTSSVQFGFILGTLGFAIFGVADRFYPTQVFFACAVAAAAVNVLLVFTANGLGLLLTYRGLTGVFLAGIYPVGMKVAADWFQNGLGNALGFLVGALVLGTGFPFLLSSSSQGWEALLLETSGLAAVSGLVMGLIVPDGPHRKQGSKFRLDGVFTLFQENKEFRSAAFGYFGHMWELYAFWAFVPVVWKDLIEQSGVGWSADAVSFAVIAVGFVGCAVGGIVSKQTGSALVARVTLAASGISCVLSPAAFLVPAWLALAFYIVWGIAVVADSPQFSSLVAQSTPAERKGSALTIVNCIGFAITIGSIQLLSALEMNMDSRFLFLFLTPGPIFGIWNMKTDFRTPKQTPGDTTGQTEDQEATEQV